MAHTAPKTNVAHTAPKTNVAHTAPKTNDGAHDGINQSFTN